MSSEAYEVIKKELLKIGLSEDAVTLYMMILGRGPLTLGEISMISNLPFQTIEKELKNLIQHELIRELPVTPPRYEALPPLKLFAKGFEHVLTLFKELDQTLKDALEKNISKIDETTRTTLERHFELLKKELFKSIDSIVVDLKTKVTDVISSSIMKEFEEMKGEIDRINMTINAIYDALISAEKEAPKEVWIIKGLKSIFAHIRDSISRAKLWIRIVVPEISQLPMEEIEKLPDNVRLQIVARYDPNNNKHREIISKLSSRKFVQIRSKERCDMISLIIDEKEVLFAPYNEKNPESIYGIVAVQEDMVFALRDFFTYAWTTARFIEL